MCLWCEVEHRVYRSYLAQEKKALAEIENIRQECPAEIDGEECPDRPRCLWEKKLEFVMARMQRERLAAEMAESERCGATDTGKIPRRIPPPSVPPHLMMAFERYVETLFDRLTGDSRTGSPTSVRRRGRKLIPFGPPGDSPR